MKILAIIPAYNEEGNILSLIDEFKKLNPKVDYLVVNDCSSDRTKEILVNNKINHVSHPINLGLSETVKTGFRYALRMQYDCAVQIDGDGQHDPESIFDLAQEMENDHLDFVQGSRFKKDIGKKKPFSLRMLGSSLISFAILITTGKKILDPTNGMRMFNRDLMHLFINQSSLYVEPDTIAFLIKDKYKMKEVFVNVRIRKYGRSYLTSFKALLYMTEVMFSILFVQFFRPRKHKKHLREIASQSKGGDQYA